MYPHNRHLSNQIKEEGSTHDPLCLYCHRRKSIPIELAHRGLSIFYLGRLVLRNWKLGYTWKLDQVMAKSNVLVPMLIK